MKTPIAYDNVLGGRADSISRWSSPRWPAVTAAVSVIGGSCLVSHWVRPDLAALVLRRPGISSNRADDQADDSSAYPGACKSVFRREIPFTPWVSADFRETDRLMTHVR